MVQENDDHRLALIVGNSTHDVLFLDGDVAAETLGGATSFVSNVLDSSLPSKFDVVSKVGNDFAYSIPNHPPLTCASSPTTLFHAHFNGGGSNSRILKRIHSCDPIYPLDLPPNSFVFGVAAAVAGEIPPQTLIRLLDLCSTVLVDVQGLIRTFDAVDGTVSLIPLRSTEYYEILPRIGFLKMSGEEVGYVELEEVRRWCTVIVTEGKDGCRVYWKDGEVKVPPFETEQVDPTGAGDSFLGGFVVGLINGLSVVDAALLGNFFGSVTVGQVGVPEFSPRMMQKVKQALERKAVGGSCWRNVVAADFLKPDIDEEFHSFLVEAAVASGSFCTSDQDDDEKLSAQVSLSQLTRKF